MALELTLPPRLREGDLVRLVSPASFPSQAHVNDTIATLNSWGLRCDTGKHILNQYGYMAGSDDQRLDDLNQAYRNPEVRAIVTTCGGAGAYRIADDIDFAAVRADPKPLIGFSDITSLHISLLERCQLGGVHGCLVGTTAQASAKQSLMSVEPLVLERDSSAVSAEVKFDGNAYGQLIGGNLQSVTTSIGIRLPSMIGAILLIEFHRLGLGTVDRYLTQLIRSGGLDSVAGVVLGSFEKFRDFSDRGWGIVDVLNDRLGVLNIPVLGGINIGHDLVDKNGDPDQYSIPLGTMATLDANEGRLTIEPVVC